MTEPTNIFKTEIVNLESLNDYTFSIPTYQRPYVWGDEQLNKLITDFHSAYKINFETPYFISTFLTKDNGTNNKTSELIDGQQRFTTLWLIAFVISKLCSGSAIENFLKINDKLRLDFEIRDEVYNYLNNLSHDDNLSDKQYNNHNIEDLPYLKNISKALESIEGFLKNIVGEDKDEIRKFGDYIYTKVYFIKNTTPKNTDLNKLFSTINNSGIQLEQTDIVKANLLKLIENKVKYSKIWETCENMNSFFERNMRLSFPETKLQALDLRELKEFDSNIFTFKVDENGASESIESNDFSIDSIEINTIAAYEKQKTVYQNEDDRDSGDVYCRSIINFGQLLLHTYRLHLKIEQKGDFEGTFHVNRLIEIFKSLEECNDPKEIERFFLLLWKVRYLFDKYVVKWVTDVNTKEEALELVNFSRNSDGYYSRTPFEKSNSLMLQSVLYFTGDYLRQYWLSSYLDYLLYNHSNNPTNHTTHLNYLEKIDNTFSLAKSISAKELSWQMMHPNNGFPISIDITKYLSESNGTGFKHYWFYKLEYVLWKNWKNRNDEKFINYRISSKNSVEHIYPQNPENRVQHPEIENEHLHSFGNLVLLSVSQNSEYSNKSVSIKKTMFNEKGNTYDTLKSFFIFSNNGDQWNSDLIIKHRDEMISILTEHYNSELIIE